MIASSSTVLNRFLLLFLAIAAMYFGRVFLIPIAAGALLSTLFLPLCRWLEQHRVVKIIAAAICLLILLLAIASLLALIGWQISALWKDAELLRDKGNGAINSIREFFDSHLGISPAEQDAYFDQKEISRSAILSRLAGSISTIFYGATLTLVYFVLFLHYRAHIRNFILRLFPESKRKVAGEVIQGATHVSQQYLVGLAKMIFCLWIMYGIAFSLLGIQNSYFYAILCGTLEIIPYIGNITGTLVTVLVAAGHGGSTPMLLGIVATYATVQFIQGWVLEPIIIGPQVRINPMATIVALIAGELLWGIPGIVLAIPLTAVLKIICDHIDALKPYGFLIGNLKTKKQVNPVYKRISGWMKKHGS